MSDIDTAAVDSLKVLDPNRPIREADIDAAKPPVGVLPFSLLVFHDTMPYLDCEGRR